MEAKTLSRAAWIDRATQRLIEAGPEAVRVEALAKVLGVTKGSFYWHFADRAELVAALLASWRDASTAAIMAEVEARGGDPIARFRRLSGRMARQNGRLENAMRAWGASDPSVRAAVAELDALRVNYLERLFGEIGFEPREARARGAYVYQALVGRFAISPDPLDASEREMRARIFAALVAPPPKG